MGGKHEANADRRCWRVCTLGDHGGCRIPGKRNPGRYPVGGRRLHRHGDALRDPARRKGARRHRRHAEHDRRGRGHRPEPRRRFGGGRLHPADGRRKSDALQGHGPWRKGLWRVRSDLHPRARHPDAGRQQRRALQHLWRDDRPHQSQSRRSPFRLHRPRRASLGHQRDDRRGRRRA